MNVRHAPLSAALEVHKSIDEFRDGPKQSRDDFEKRYVDKHHCILVAYDNELPVGYVIAYDRDDDGSLYCWMAGVRPDRRRKGVLSALMNELERWAKRHDYDAITIKTRNSRRGMLRYLAKAEFLFTAIEERDDPMQNRIHARRAI